MSFTEVPKQWKEAFGSGTFPELVEIYQKQIELKKKSRVLMKKKDIVWDERHPQAKTAALVDPRLGFANTYANVGLSHIAPGTKSGKHKHGEAIIYILQGKGYSIVDEKRYDWEEGDAVYIPPDTYHQHFNLDNEKPVVFLRVLPGPLQVNLIAIAAALGFPPLYSMEVAELKPNYEKGKGEEVKKYMKG
jgi:gentisate 1,2-dioxygenase